MPFFRFDTMFLMFLIEMFEEFGNGTVVDLICSESILCLCTLVDVSYVILMKVEPRAGYSDTTLHSPVHWCWCRVMTLTSHSHLN